MPSLNWVAQEDLLTAAALTVRAQAISPNDRGQLFWDAFMPRRNVDSVKVNEISTIDFRPAADRREWNTRGRNIPLKTPNLAEMEMVPIEAFFKIDEREVQTLTERTLGNESLFRQLIGASVPARVDSLVGADYRRIELDVMSAWALGVMTVKNPSDGSTYSVDYNFDSARYQTASPAWTNITAYANFIAWCEDAIDACGPIAGVHMRLSTFKAIQASAPQGINAIQLTRAQVEAQVAADLGQSFRFYINENSLDVFNDGGTAVTRTKIWPANTMAIVPAGGAVGFTAFAPVARSFDLARSTPNAGIDIRGVSVFPEISGNGRELTYEAQVNAMPIPDENKLFIIDAGI